MVIDHANRPFAVVTGASSGIGLELARQLARRGFDLLVAAEDEHLDDAAAGLRGSGAGVEGVRVDLSTVDGVDRLADRMRAAQRPVDALVLNAGVGVSGQDTGVTVTTLMPGPTDTGFFERADMEDTKLGRSKMDDPVDVARDGIDAMMAGKDHVVAGSVKNRLQVAAANAMPDRAVAAAHATLSEPGSGT